MKLHPELLAQSGDFFDFRQAIDRAHLSGLSDRYNPRLGMMLESEIMQVGKIPSGVSLPSGEGTVSTLQPEYFSGAPHSSTCRWAISEQITEFQEW